MDIGKIVQNVKLFLENIKSTLKIKQQEDWYKITKKRFN